MLRQQRLRELKKKTALMGERTERGLREGELHPALTQVMRWGGTGAVIPMSV